MGCLGGTAVQPIIGVYWCVLGGTGGGGAASWTGQGDAFGMSLAWIHYMGVGLVAWDLVD